MTWSPGLNSRRFLLARSQSYVLAVLTVVMADCSRHYKGYALMDDVMSPSWCTIADMPWVSRRVIWSHEDGRAVIIDVANCSSVRYYTPGSGPSYTRLDRYNGFVRNLINGGFRKWSEERR